MPSVYHISTLVDHGIGKKDVHLVKTDNTIFVACYRLRPFNIAFNNAGLVVWTIFPLKFVFSKRKQTNKKPQKNPLATLISPLNFPLHLVSAYLNSLRVKVYFCEISMSQYNCIWHCLTICSVSRATTHLEQ